MKQPYSMVIQWSQEDRVYVVTLPEFPGCHTHGETYEGAARHGREVMETLVELYEEENRALPKPSMFGEPLMITEEETAKIGKRRKGAIKKPSLAKTKAS